VSLENPITWLVCFPIVAYLIGSTPFGTIIARFKGVDLRKAGSGNVGATNVGRVLGAKWGYLCFALDVGKGLLPVLLAGWLLRNQESFPTLIHQAIWLATGFGAIAGHVLSFWLRFRGGKGVATALGVVVGIYPYFTWPGLCALGLWIVVTLASRYVSLGSIVAAVAFVPLLVAFRFWQVLQLWPLGLFALAVCVLIIFRHRSNISRLIKGTENKIRSKGTGDQGSGIRDDASE